MSHGYNSVTNDKCAIKYTNDGFIVYGIAQSVSIRMSKEFRENPENYKYVQYALNSGHVFSDEKMLEGNNIVMNDIELANLNNVNQIEDSILKVIINPVYDSTIDSPLFDRMKKIDALNLIKSQLLPLVHETTSFFNNIQLNGVQIYNPKLTIDKLSSVPCYNCVQNERTTKEFVEKVKQLSLEKYC